MYQDGNGRRYLLKPLRDVDSARTLAALTRPERAESRGVLQVIEGLVTVGSGLAIEN